MQAVARLIGGFTLTFGIILIALGSGRRDGSGARRPSEMTLPAAQPDRAYS